MEMRNVLLKEKTSSSLKLLTRYFTESDVVRVSTIDRLQGDESNVSKYDRTQLENMFYLTLSFLTLYIHSIGIADYHLQSRG